ncbi:MAG: ABC transporter substrate-binding protein [Acidimicrobiia bacterium]
MNRYHDTRSFVACVAALAITAAACGGGDDGAGAQGDGAETAGTIDADVQSGVKSALEGTTTSAGSATTAAQARPQSIEEWEELWAEERAAVVAKIKKNGWGLSADGNTLTGPEGFTIDLTACTDGWSDTQGLTDTEIKIGDVVAQSGIGADNGLVWKTADLWFKYHSDLGSFTDSNGKTRKINFVVRDDGYDVARAIPLVDEMLDSEKVFALWTFGTPAGLKVYDKINQYCVPHPTLIGGSPAWGDPVNHPWTTGSYIAYTTEAVIWAAFIDQNFAELSAGDGKVTVGGLVANSDFGATYENAFRAAIAESPNKDDIEFVTEKFEITAPTVTDPMTTLASKNLDLFITMTGGVQCTQIINEAAQNGMSATTKFRFMSSVCKSAAYVGKEKVGGDGSQADGWYIVGGGYKDIGASENDDDPFSIWGRQFFTERGVDYKASGNYGYGFFLAWLWTQTLRIAGDLPGGLTRTNFILAQRAFEGTSPIHLEGVAVNMNGNADAFFVEGSDLSVYDSAKQAWIVQGDVIELSGKSPNCAWDVTVSACK